MFLLCGRNCTYPSFSPFHDTHSAFTLSADALGPEYGRVSIRLVLNVSLTMQRPQPDDLRPFGTGTSANRCIGVFAISYIVNLLREVRHLRVPLSHKSMAYVVAALLESAIHRSWGETRDAFVEQIISIWIHPQLEAGGLQEA